MQFTIILTALASIATLVGAAPVTEEKRDVYVPPVLYPKTGTVWHSGEVRQHAMTTMY